MGLEKLKDAFEFYKREWGGRLSWEIFSKRVKVVRQKLIDIAKEEKTITYEELMKEFRIGRAYIGGILGSICELERFQKGPMLSAVVINKGTRNPGGGFLSLPGIPEGIRRARDFKNPRYNEVERNYWEQVLKEVYRYWRKA